MGLEGGFSQSSLVFLHCLSPQRQSYRSHVPTRPIAGQGHTPAHAKSTKHQAAGQPLADGSAKDGAKNTHTKKYTQKLVLQRVHFSAGQFLVRSGLRIGGIFGAHVPGRVQGQGAQQPHSTPPSCLHNPANPSSCLTFPFLAKITPEHVSMLSCKESHFREAFSFSPSFPL